MVLSLPLVKLLNNIVKSCVHILILLCFDTDTDTDNHTYTYTDNNNDNYISITNLNFSNYDTKNIYYIFKQRFTTWK